MEANMLIVCELNLTALPLMRHIRELAPQTQTIVNQILGQLTLVAQMIAFSLIRPGKM